MPAVHCRHRGRGRLGAAAGDGGVGGSRFFKRCFSRLADGPNTHSTCNVTSRNVVTVCGDEDKCEEKEKKSEERKIDREEKKKEK